MTAYMCRLIRNEPRRKVAAKKGPLQATKGQGNEGRKTREAEKAA